MNKLLPRRINSISRTGIVLATFFIFSTASAATLFEMKSDDSSDAIVYVEGTKLRVESSQEPGYSVIDLVNRKMIVVNPDERTTLDMSSMLGPADRDGSSLDDSWTEGSLEKVGDGPIIAGYETVHYVLKANGDDCQDLYFSKKAYKDSGLDKGWWNHAKAWTAMGVDPDDACEVAEAQAVDYEEYGWPLKTVQKESMHEGQFEEVVRIEKNAKIPAGGFDIPAGYKTVNMAEMMSSMGTGMGDDMGFDGMDSDDEMYEDETYDDEEFVEEEYVEEEYEEMEEEQNEVEEFEDKAKNSLKGFMNRFKKKDKDGGT